MSIEIVLKPSYKLAIDLLGEEQKVKLLDMLFQYGVEETDVKDIPEKDKSKYLSDLPVCVLYQMILNDNK